MRTFVIVSIILVGNSFPLFAQRNPDIGMRFNTNEYNRFQFEYRHPFAEQAYFRVGLTMGFQNRFPYSRIMSASDTLVTMREFNSYGRQYGLRFGIEKQIAFPFLSFHADLGVNYFSSTSRNASYYHFLDSSGVWNRINTYPGTNNDSSYTAMANDSWLGADLSIGLSFNFPVTENFIISFTGNYTGLLSTVVGHKETNDVYDEFFEGSGTNLELYMSAGIGFRYVFAPREAPAPMGD